RCRHVQRALLRNALLDVTTIVPATACLQRNDVRTYRRDTANAYHRWVCKQLTPPVILRLLQVRDPIKVSIHSCWITDVPSYAICSKAFVISSGRTPLALR